MATPKPPRLWCHCSRSVGIRPRPHSRKTKTTPLKQFFVAWDAVFRCLRGVDDERWCRAARQHGKMLARPYASTYVRAAQAGSYGLELITAACDEPRALERVLKSLGKAFSDDVDENNVAAL